LGATATADAGSSSATPVQVQRYLRIKNDTGEKLTVYVQYRTLVDRDQWLWVPADPRQSPDEVATFEVAAGSETFLGDGADRVKGSRVRMWAASEGGKQWTDAKQKDFWLVPETDAKGAHYYYAADTQSFTYTFSQ
jgi:hypothetical protein